MNLPVGQATSLPVLVFIHSCVRWLKAPSAKATKVKEKHPHYVCRGSLWSSPVSPSNDEVVGVFVSWA